MAVILDPSVSESTLLICTVGQCLVSLLCSVVLYVPRQGRLLARQCFEQYRLFVWKYVFCFM